MTHGAPPGDWQRLSPRMLLVHPVHEVLRQIPVIVGTLVLGTATGNPVLAFAALGITVAIGVARWFTTSYRIGPGDVQLRTGVLQRKFLSVPRNRIRSVSTDARLLHRLLGLTVLRVSTGQEARSDAAFALDAVPSEQVSRLRAVLLADSLVADADQPAAPGRVLARWTPSWLRYSPLSFTGLAMIAAAAGVVYQVAAGGGVRDSDLARSGLDAAERFGVVASVAIVAVVLLLASVVLSVLQSLLTYGNLELRRDFEVLHLRHGLIRVREHTFDMRRLRGGTLREPLLVRLFGGARLDAVMTGVGGEGQASLLLPPCPKRTAEAVLTDLIERRDAVSGALRAHGPAATRRRWTRALLLPILVAVVLLVAPSPAWVWVPWAVLTGCCALLAADRARSLGHRVGDGWVVARTGSFQRRRDCIEASGIIGWTVRQTLMQRRARVATLVAATAAGVKHYQVLDVPADLAWSIAAEASPWVADCRWADR
ncbi:PH domain-containing protein [Mycolicibacterium sp. ND9-15]|uniref:PH domain-containing protein n=1 Tax=Mycolicibacterium sp. ND9-15 TaxID=3042320 RepID=UPI002DD9DCBA|nr:PH domain-containing protein [Mycolicibacterium sp. ND9-15]WSE58002.1 PH domain-containing protein [Mycolicibacterium sp. ND9-15]